jgi:hypothetical protein
MAALFGKKSDDGEAQATGPQAGEEIARLEGLALPDLAAEVMAKCFGPGGPGEPGRPGTIEAPGLADERVRLNDVAGAVSPAYTATSDATEQLRIANLIAEGLQALELAALIRVTWRGGTEDFRATRRGRGGQERGEVQRQVAASLGEPHDRR